MSYAGRTTSGQHGARRTGLPVHSAARGKAAGARAAVEHALLNAPRTSRAARVQHGEPTRSEPDWKRIVLFTAGALLGATVGAGATLLLAPQSGEETRQDLARRGRRLRIRTADAWDDLRDELRRAARRGRRRLSRRWRERRDEREYGEASV
jgi:gas vesicle protein